MRVRGIDPKGWFYGLRQQLRGDPGNRIVFTGSACEQWVNGILFRVIAERLPRSLTAYPEWKRRQHDIAVLRVTQEKGRAVVDWKRPVTIIENKLIYLSYRAARRNALIEKLVQQLHARSTAKDRVGFLLAAYVYRPHEVVPKESFDMFREDVGARFRTAARAVRRRRVTFDHEGSMETVLKETVVRVGGEQVVVACAGQYVRLRSK